MNNDRRHESFTAFVEAYESEQHCAMESHARFSEQLHLVQQSLETMTRDALAQRATLKEAAEKGRREVEALRQEYADALTAREAEAEASRIAELENKLSDCERALQEMQARAAAAEKKLQEGAGEQIQQHITEMESHLEQRRETITTARHRILRLQEKIVAIAAERAGALQRAADFEAQLERRNAALKASEDRFTEMRRKIEGSGDVATAQLRALERQIEDKGVALHDAETQMVALQARLETHTSERAQVDERCRALEELLEDSAHEVKTAHERLIAAQREQARQAALMEALEQQRDADNVARQEAEATCRALGETLDQHRSDSARLEQEQGAASKAIAERSAQLEQAREALAGAEERATVLEAQLRRADQDADTASLETARLQELLDLQQQTAGESASRVTSLDSSLEAERARMIETEAALTKLRQEYDQTGASLDEAHARIAALESDLSERDATIELAERRAEEAEEALAQAQALSSTVEERVADIRGELEVQRQTTLQAQEAQSLARTDAEAAQEAANQASKNAAEARAALQSMAADTEVAEEMLRQWKLRIDEAEKRELTSQQDAEKVRQEVAALRAQLESANRTRHEKEVALAALRTEMETLEEECQALAAEKEAIMREQDAMQAEIDRLDEVHRQAPAPETLAALQHELDQARNRAAALEQKVNDDLATGTKATLARQLADALCDAEEAREQTRALRRELDQHKRSAGPRPASPEEKVPGALSRDPRKGLAEIVVEAGIVSRNRMNDLETEQQAQPSCMLSELLLQKDLIDQQRLAEIIALQCDVPLIALEADLISSETVVQLPDRVARMHCCIPIRMAENKIEVAFFDPMKPEALADVERETGKAVTPVVATRAAIESAIDKYYWEPE